MRIAAFLGMVLLLIAATVPRTSMSVTAEECDPNYLGACVPNNASKVTCDQIKAKVVVANVDVHGLDQDKDGYACESYATASSTTKKTTTPGTNGAGASNGSSGNCSTVFVAGKGVIDSCSGERKDTSRVYPRKPGVPAQGCKDACPEVTDPAQKPSGTPVATSNSNTGVPKPTPETPVDTQHTPSMDLGQQAAPPQNCDRVSYPDVCIPAAPPYLGCSEIPDRNFRVRAPDPHRFDADGNGIGCEEVRGPTIGR